jgi:hypothetical protein
MIPFHDIGKYRVGLEIVGGGRPAWPSDAHRGNIMEQLKCNISGNGHEHIPEFIINFISSLWKNHPHERGEMSEIVDNIQFMLHRPTSGKVDQLKKIFCNTKFP